MTAPLWRIEASTASPAGLWLHTRDGDTVAITQWEIQALRMAQREDVTGDAERAWLDEFLRSKAKAPMPAPKDDAASDDGQDQPAPDRTVRDWAISVVLKQGIFQRSVSTAEGAAQIVRAADILARYVISGAVPELG